ncbi:MAG: hypothetical protein ACOC5K_03325, partial [Chloroflexota bacterium]
MKVIQAMEEARRIELQRGRGGCKPAPHPVELEPPFEPFDPRPGSNRAGAPRAVLRRVEPVTDLQTVGVSLSSQDSYSQDLALQLLGALRPERPIAFELVARDGRLKLQFTASARDMPQITGQVQGLYAHAQVSPAEDPIARAWNGLVARGCRLRESHLFPLGSGLRTEPYASVAGILPQLGPGELAGLQVLLSPARQPWRENFLRVTGDRWDPGASAFADVPDMPKHARAKTESPLFAVGLRLFASNPSLLQAVENALLPQLESAENGLSPCSELYPAEAIGSRYTCTPGMLLNTRELAALVHLPDPSTLPDGVLERVRSTAPAPPSPDRPVVSLGVNRHRGEERRVDLDQEALSRHVFIQGFTGSGKSTLLKEVLVSLIEGGYGAAFLDYAGDAAWDLLDLVPERRAGDVVYINPGDRDEPPGLNVLQAAGREPEALASELMVGLKRLFHGRSELGPRMEWL